MEYLIFIPVVSWVVLLAWYDAMFQTKHIIPFSFIHICFCLLLAAALPFINWWQGVVAFTGTIIWYNYIYNVFADLSWYYLDNKTKLNRFLKRFDAYALLLIRVLIFIMSFLLFITV